MTKLYHNGELEGWQVPGQQAPKAARVDVPGSPAELAAWLNFRRVGPTGAAAAHDRELEELEALREPAGAVLTAADVDKVNNTRPEFLPRLTADEIERRRLALGRCPKCGTMEPTDYGRVRGWIETAPLEELQRIAEAIQGHCAELNDQLERAGEARQ